MRQKNVTKFLTLFSPAGDEPAGGSKLNQTQASFHSLPTNKNDRSAHMKTTVPNVHTILRGCSACAPRDKLQAMTGGSSHHDTIITLRRPSRNRFSVVCCHISIRYVSTLCQCFEVPDTGTRSDTSTPGAPTNYQEYYFRRPDSKRKKKLSEGESALIRHPFVAARHETQTREVDRRLHADFDSLTHHQTRKDSSGDNANVACAAGNSVVIKTGKKEERRGNTKEHTHSTHVTDSQHTSYR